jgi:hypothetical protein
MGHGSGGWSSPRMAGTAGSCAEAWRRRSAHIFICSAGVPTRVFESDGTRMHRGWGHPRYNLPRAVFPCRVTENYYTKKHILS